MVWYKNGMRRSLVIYHGISYNQCSAGWEGEYRAYAHDVIVAMLVYKTNPVGVELFSYVNAFF